MKAFKDVYREAYETGLKGCTTYRPNDITGSVLRRSMQRLRAQARRPCRSMRPAARPAMPAPTWST